MARKIHRLTALSVKRETAPGSYSDGGNLSLLVGPSGAKSWVFRYTFDGGERYMGLGPLHTVSLGEARDAAADCRKLLLSKQDPMEVRRSAVAVEVKRLDNVRTFKEAALEYMERKGKDVEQWTPALDKYAYPIFGTTPVSEIDNDRVLKVLTPIWKTIHVTATRVRQRIENVLDYSRAMGYRTGDNPARWEGNLEYALQESEEAHKVEHHPSLPYVQIHDFMQQLKGMGGTAKLALEFLILTGTRTSEVIGATWDEFDLEEMAWSIPAERMKAAEDFRVPLTDRAVEIVKTMESFKRNGETHVFPGQKFNKGLSIMAFSNRLDLMHKTKKWIDPKLGRLITTHGFRSTFADWGREVGRFSQNDIDACLSHTVKNKVTTAYQRGELFDLRREIMQAWLKYIQTPRLAAVKAAA